MQSCVLPAALCVSWRSPMTCGPSGMKGGSLASKLHSFLQHGDPAYRTFITRLMRQVRILSLIIPNLASRLAHLLENTCLSAAPSDLPPHIRHAAAVDGVWAVRGPVPRILHRGRRPCPRRGHVAIQVPHRTESAADVHQRRGRQADITYWEIHQLHPPVLQRSRMGSGSKYSCWTRRR